MQYCVAVRHIVVKEDLKPASRHESSAFFLTLANPVIELFFVVALSDPCLVTTCDFDAKCVKSSNGSTECECRNDCQQIYSPICASDERTYPNNCSMIFEACRTQTMLTVVKEGVCEGIKSCLIKYIYH